MAMGLEEPGTHTHIHILIPREHTVCSLTCDSASLEPLLEGTRYQSSPEKKKQQFVIFFLVRVASSLNLANHFFSVWFHVPFLLVTTTLKNKTLPMPMPYPPPPSPGNALPGWSPLMKTSCRDHQCAMELVRIQTLFPRPRCKSDGVWSTKRLVNKR